jgi:Protein of unknown function DUF2834
MEKRVSNLQVVYGICALAGITTTMYYNILFVLEHQGFSMLLFISENYVNNASSSIMNDLWVILATFLVWSFREARRLSIPNWWLYVAASFGVALAFSLPLFLFVREHYLKQIK